ncbi:phosphotransferase [Roseicyclus sp.]|uniref:phosphotransferase n=1 Tax=Roseicyclus sp. TaxID=1914329 RepID=UPI003FA06126
MHAQTVPVTEAQIRDALATGAPAFAGLPVTPLVHGGTETRVFRLGEHHLLRMPLELQMARIFANEARCLQHMRLFGHHLPLAFPRVEAIGRIATNPPLPWTIQPWIEGEDATVAMPSDQGDLADRLAAFLRALHGMRPPDIVALGPRGGPLAPDDSAFRRSLNDAAAAGLTGLGPAIAAWEAGLSARPWDGRPVWLHGDLVPGNLIIAHGKLVAVIDWSFVTLGDPAYDLIPAWFLLDPPARSRFLDQLDPDAATVARGRARVAWQCVMALPYYLDRNPAMVGLARRGLAALETDDG